MFTEPTVNVGLKISPLTSKDGSISVPLPVLNEKKLFVVSIISGKTETVPVVIVGLKTCEAELISVGIKTKPLETTIENVCKLFSIVEISTETAPAVIVGVNNCVALSIIPVCTFRSNSGVNNCAALSSLVRFAVTVPRKKVGLKTYEVEPISVGNILFPPVENTGLNNCETLSTLERLTVTVPRETVKSLNVWGFSSNSGKTCTP